MELSGPLRIAEVPIPVPGSLGITHCPGRNRIDSAGYQWKRNLRDDLRDLMAWGAGAVLTLVEEYEFAHLGVPEFATEMRSSRLVWYHMAIPDGCSSETDPSSSPFARKRHHVVRYVDFSPVGA